MKWNKFSYTNCCTSTTCASTDWTCVLAKIWRIRRFGPREMPNARMHGWLAGTASRTRHTWQHPIYSHPKRPKHAWHVSLMMPWQIRRRYRRTCNNVVREERKRKRRKQVLTLEVWGSRRRDDSSAIPVEYGFDVILSFCSWPQAPFGLMMPL